MSSVNEISNFAVCAKISEMWQLLLSVLIFCSLLMWLNSVIREEAYEKGLGEAQLVGEVAIKVLRNGCQQTSVKLAQAACFSTFPANISEMILTLVFGDQKS